MPEMPLETVVTEIRLKLLRPEPMWTPMLDPSATHEHQRPQRGVFAWVAFLARALPLKALRVRLWLQLHGGEYHKRSTRQNAGYLFDLMGFIGFAMRSIASAARFALSIADCESIGARASKTVFTSDFGFSLS